MRFSKIFLAVASLLSTIAAQEFEEWNPEKVYIVDQSNLTLSGNGCELSPILREHGLNVRPVSVSWPISVSNVNASWLVLYMTAASMYARVGTDIPLEESHKSCRVEIPIEYPRGYRYNIYQINASPLHSVPDEHLGLVYSTVSYKDYPEGGITKTEKIFSGPYLRPGSGAHQLDIINKPLATSPCGGDVRGDSERWGALVVDTDVKLVPKRQVTLPAPEEFGVLAVFYYLEWHTCTPNDSESDE